MHVWVGDFEYQEVHVEGLVEEYVPLDIEQNISECNLKRVKLKGAKGYKRHMKCN
eukprot:CAMPEP_0119048274 /NCGR_PEP_ID=MMETSP1177-20130426/58093_1 /TAXON_ID=2985 /ORGANISM="Ochromonas sp, Strain CCMP1899" /LENGTH=54 /DNA_ID=CAMNT_0007023945 /DNA_START=112 /DNA_END=276 /DNA_ORIENTATION=+